MQLPMDLFKEIWKFHKLQTICFWRLGTLLWDRKQTHGISFLSSKGAKGQKGIPNALMGALKGDQAWGNRGGAPYSGRGGTSIGIDGEGIWLGHWQWPVTKMLQLLENWHLSLKLFCFLFVIVMFSFCHPCSPLVRDAIHLCVNRGLG